MHKLGDIVIDDIIDSLLYKKYLSRQFPLNESQIYALLQASKSCFILEPMLLELKPPINVCGDFHGQFEDLKYMLKMRGSPEEGQNYLFLGDYVDRGRQSLECICLLLAYKVKYRNNFFLLRGNHQCSEVNKIYGFFDQCKRRVNLKVWKAFGDCFNCLPLAAVVGSRVFCVHGGLSPSLSHLSQINTIRRPISIDRGTMLCDLLWSDPTMEDKGWLDNIQRGISYIFGKDVISHFLSLYDFDLICRSHQVVEDGYEFGENRQIITIFSAPNYCNRFDNLAAILIIEEDLKCHIKQFSGRVERKFRRYTTPGKSNSPRENIFLKVPQHESDERNDSNSRSKSHRNTLNLTPLKSRSGNLESVKGRKKTDLIKKK